MDNNIKLTDDVYKKKYLKYKNKYIKKQLSKEEELVGGVFEDIYILCPKDVYQVIKELYEKNNRISDLDLFLYSLGPRSYYIKYGTKDTNNFYTGENFPNFWAFTEEEFPKFGTKIQPVTKKKFIFWGQDVTIKKEVKNVEDLIDKKKTETDFTNYQYFYLKNKVLSRTDYEVIFPEN